MVVCSGWGWLLFVLLSAYAWDSNRSIPECSTRDESDYSNRSLYILSFENRGTTFALNKLRSLSKRFGSGLQEVVVLGAHVQWSPLKVFNKPVHYAQWINATVKKLEGEKKNVHDFYALVIDSDVIINARPLKELWDAYECARNGRSIVLSAETSCWVGLQCTRKELSRYYSELGPTLNTFVNSGSLMGSLPALQKMFNYLNSNIPFFLRRFPSLKYPDDQAAITHYYSRNRGQVEIDYYQQLFGTMSIFSDVHKNGRRNHFHCRSFNSDKIATNCTEILFPSSMYSVDDSNCLLNINLMKGAGILNQFIMKRFPTPFIFHGNANGKRMYKKLNGRVMDCLKKSNFTPSNGNHR